MGANDGRVVEEGAAEETILRVAGKLRALSNNGLRFADNPYQTETFEQMLALCAELTALVDARPLAKIQRHFFDDTRYISPYTVVDSAVFDDSRPYSPDPTGGQRALGAAGRVVRGGRPAGGGRGARGMGRDRMPG